MVTRLFFQHLYKLHLIYKLIKEKNFDFAISHIVNLNQELFYKQDIYAYFDMIKKTINRFNIPYIYILLYLLMLL